MGIHLSVAVAKEKEWVHFMASYFLGVLLCISHDISNYVVEILWPTFLWGGEGPWTAVA